MIDEEIWRRIEEAPAYDVSSHGRVRRGAHVLTPRDTGTGYLALSLYPDGIRLPRKVHRLVCRAFHGAPPSGKNDAAHKDGNRGNNHYRNLRWTSRGENMADAQRHGTLWSPRGSANPSSKLTEEIVLTIRAAPRRRGMMRELAERFGITPKMVGDLRSKRGYWPHCQP
jgi:hypothetical protein